MWRDHRVKSARRREKGVRSIQLGWMRRDNETFDAPLPTAPNRKDAQFQQRCAKRKMGMESSIIHKSLLKHVATSQRSLEVSFSKKRKKWGVFQRYAWDLLSEGNQSWIDDNDLRTSVDKLMLIRSTNHRTKNLINKAKPINNLSQILARWNCRSSC